MEHDKRTSFELFKSLLVAMQTEVEQRNEIISKQISELQCAQETMLRDAAHEVEIVAEAWCIMSGSCISAMQPVPAAARKARRQPSQNTSPS